MLNQRRVAGVETLILADPKRVTFAIARQFTNWAIPQAHEIHGFGPGRLDVNSLCELVVLIEQLKLRGGEKSRGGLVK